MSTSATKSSSLTSIDNISIEETVSPPSMDDLAEIVRDCHAADRAIFPMGGGTAIEVGLPPTRSGVLVDVSTVNRVVDYPNEDMTITVESGVRVQDLTRILAKQGQTLPIDCANPEIATLGGALATATSGPRRFGYGTLRDYVIGIDTIHADGARVHGGGRVVKNVAGYDFMKLHTGAYGSLGIIAQVTLKLKPLPEARAAVTCTVTADQLEPVLARLSHSQLRPVGIELLGGAASTEVLGHDNPHWQLVLLFEESLPANAWQVKECEQELADAKVRELQVVSDDEYRSMLDRLIVWQADPSGPLSFKANVLPGKVAEYCQFARQQLPEVAILAHAGNGIVWGALSETDFESAKRGLESLRRLAFANSGNLIIPRCPVEWKEWLPVWGAPRGDWVIMEKLKRQLDPKNILNPGRLFRFQ